MLSFISQLLQSVMDVTSRLALQKILNLFGDRLISQSLSSAGLVIKAGASPIVKLGASTYYGIANGVLVSKAGSTDMAALVGTVTNARFNVFCFLINSAGTLSTAMGAEAATLGAVAFPSIPQGSALIGFLIINPTGTGNFVGGTTALDDATVAPNAAYVNTIGAFNPNIRL